jgi:hypothetical protein
MAVAEGGREAILPMKVREQERRKMALVRALVE